MSQNFPGAVPPPPGVVPDINATAGEIPAITYAVTTLEVVFPTIALTIRLYVRFSLMEKWTRVDSCFILAYALLVANIGFGYTFPEYGLGKHVWDVTASDFSNFLKYENLQQLIYEFAVLFSKTTLLLQLEEIFAPKGSSFSGRRRFLWIMVILNATFFLIEAFLRIFQCIPREKIWDASLPGHCLDVSKAFVSTSAVNVLEDFIILILPVVWVSQMKISLKRKVLIAGVFSLGIFVCICSVMRLVGSIRGIGSTDVTISLVQISLWAQAEEAAALTITCLPLLPRIIKRIRHGSTSSAPARSWEMRNVPPSSRTRHRSWQRTKNATSSILHGRTFTSIGSVDTLPQRSAPTSSNTAGEAVNTGGILKTVDISQISS